MYRDPRRSASYKKILKYLIQTVFFLLIVTLLGIGFNFLVYQDIQKRLGIQLKGQYVPVFLLPKFEFRQGSFIWKNKVQLVQGDFELTFDPLTVLSRGGIRLIVTSQNSELKLLGDWALQGSGEKMTVDTLFADIVLGRRGLTAINQIEVKSKAFQFSLKDVDKKPTS